MHKLLDKDGAQHLVDKFLSDQGLQDNKLDEIEEKFDNLYSIVGIEHYGIKIDKNNSDTSARIVYTHDCENYTPARMNYTNGVFEIGSWGNAFFMKNNYPAMCNFYGVEQYKLDPNDHSLKEDGTSSDVADTTYNGNAMSVFDCHIWMKFYEDEDYQYLEVSNYKLDDDFKDYPYVRADGSKADKLYYPMYPGYKDSNNKLRSISGVTSTSYTTTAQEVQYASNCGENWFIGDWSHYLWLNSLMLLISKNLNSQEAFGNGNMISGSFATNGTLNTSGQFFGYSTATSSMKAFYCENVYANRDQRLLGFYNDKGTYKIKMIPPYTHNETFEGYTTVSTPTVSYPDGYVKDLAFDTSYGLLPKTVGGSSTTYVGDRFYVNNSQVDILLAGGGCSAGSDCGSWCLRLNVRTANVGSGYGASSYLTEPVHFDLNTIYGSSPIYFEQDNYAQPLADYTIFGNSYQDGTPTPDDPVEVVSVGEKTENLLDMYSSEIEDCKSLSRDGSEKRDDFFCITGYIQIKPNTYYTINKTNIGGGDRCCCFYDKNKIFISSSNVSHYADKYTMLTPANAFYIRCSILSISMYPQLKGSHMLTEGENVPQSYIPYGYKIPITCGGVTQNIYLDEPLRKIGDYADYVDYSSGKIVRRIGKKVFYGTEDFSIGFANAPFRYILSAVSNDNKKLCFSNMYAGMSYTESWSQYEYGVCVHGAFLFRDIRFPNYSYLDSFKQFLAAQYSNGTPVTIYYVLAKPIEKDPPVPFPTIAPTPGSNTLSIGTTLQPSQVSITGHIKEISQ